MEIRGERYWVVDVEGNGGSPPEIIELAMIEVVGLTLSGQRKHWFIRPDKPIQPAASRIHGITNDDVASAPSMEDIVDDIMLWLDQGSIVGHHVKTEVDIISRSIPSWSPKVAIDTIKIAKILRPGLESYSLEKLGLALNQVDEAARLSGRSHHSALYDATLTALIFIDLVSNVPEYRRQNILRDADILDIRQGSLL